MENGKIKLQKDSDWLTIAMKPTLKELNIHSEYFTGNPSVISYFSAPLSHIAVLLYLFAVHVRVLFEYYDVFSLRKHSLMDISIFLH